MYDRWVQSNGRPPDITEIDYVGGIAVKQTGKGRGAFETIIASAPNTDNAPSELPPEVDRRAVLQILLQQGPQMIETAPGVRSGAEVTTVMVRIALHYQGGIVYLVPVPPTERERKYDTFIIRKNYSKFHIDAIQRKGLRVMSTTTSYAPSVNVDAVGSNLHRRA